MIIMTMMTMKTMNMMTVIKSPTLMNMTLKIKNTSERRTRRILEWNTLGKQRWQDIASGTALAWIVNAVAYGHWMRLKMKLYFLKCLARVFSAHASFLGLCVGVSCRCLLSRNLCWKVLAQRSNSNRRIQRLQAAKLTKGMTSINQATPLAKLRTKEQIGKTSQLILKKDGWQLPTAQASWKWT